MFFGKHFWNKHFYKFTLKVWSNILLVYSSTTNIKLKVDFYAYQLLKDIQHVHKKGRNMVIYISPANILVNDNLKRGVLYKIS